MNCSVAGGARRITSEKGTDKGTKGPKCGESKLWLGVVFGRRSSVGYETIWYSFRTMYSRSLLIINGVSGAWSVLIAAHCPATKP